MSDDDMDALYRDFPAVFDGERDASELMQFMIDNAAGSEILISEHAIRVGHDPAFAFRSFADAHAEARRQFKRRSWWQRVVERVRDVFGANY